MDTTTRSELVEQLHVTPYAIMKRTGIDQKTVKSVFLGEGKRVDKIEQVDAALIAIAKEQGIPLPPDLESATLTPVRTIPSEEPGEEPLMEFRVGGNFDVSVVVRGPVSEKDALEDSVIRLIKALNKPEE